jgi:hypothetical protein
MIVGRSERFGPELVAWPGEPALSTLEALTRRWIP